MIRFLIEYLREPDSNIGFVIAGGAQTEPLALFHSVLNISLGQILSLLMVAGGVTLLLLLTSRHKQLMSKQLNANSVKKRKK